MEDTQLGSKWPEYCIIIGGRKCGSTSLEKYLQPRTKVCMRVEQLFTTENGPEIYEKNYKDLTPIVILRDPVERAHSDHRFAVKKGRTTLSFEDYCIETLGVNTTLGNLNPIQQSNYDYWLDKWKHINIKVVYLEQMQLLPGFPQENRSWLIS